MATPYYKTVLMIMMLISTFLCRTHQGSHTDTHMP